VTPDFVRMPSVDEIYLLVGKAGTRKQWQYTTVPSIVPPAVVEQEQASPATHSVISLEEQMKAG
jgi:hypothetical protein